MGLRGGLCKLGRGAWRWNLKSRSRNTEHATCARSVGKFDISHGAIKLSAMRTKPFSPLARSFYEPSAEIVAPELLGHFLIRNTPAGPCWGAIVETES